MVIIDVIFELYNYDWLGFKRQTWLDDFFGCWIIYRNVMYGFRIVEVRIIRGFGLDVYLETLESVNIYQFFQVRIYYLSFYIIYMKMKVYIVVQLFFIRLEEKQKWKFRNVCLILVFFMYFYLVISFLKDIVFSVIFVKNYLLLLFVIVY